VSRVQYFTACTLDGFIADAENSLDWLYGVPDGEDDGSWDRFISGVGAMAMGATTYAWTLEHAFTEHPEQWQEYYGDRPCWVFTHRDLPGIPGADIRFVAGDVRPAYDAMVAARPDENIWLVGGGDLVGQFDDAGLLDEIWLGLTPVTLGAGAPLLPRRITSERMRFREAVVSGQRVRLILDVDRPS
jgi:dihydrofolate reductase